MTDHAATSVRYVQIAPTGGDSSTIRTFSRRLVNVPRPFDETVAMLRSLPAEDPATMPVDRWQLRAMLIEGRSAVPIASRVPDGARGSLTVVGELARFDALRRADTDLSNATFWSLPDLPPEPAAPGIVLLVPDMLDSESTMAVVSALTAAGHSVVPFVEFDGRGWLGSLIAPDAPVTLRDVTARLAANADMWPGSSGDRVCELGDGPERSELRWMAAVIGVELQRYLDGKPLLSAGHLLELDPSTLSIVRHPVLPWPVGDPGPAVPEGRFDPMSLVDDRAGVINRLNRFHHHPDIPQRLVSVHAHVSRMRKLTPWQTDTTTAGTSFDGEEFARQAASGEAVERYCGNIVQPKLLREASWSELTGTGEHAVDPDSLVLFSDTQYAAAGFPFTRFTRDLRTFWVRGRSLTHGRPTWLPASLSYPNWHSGPYEATPPIANPYFAGLAAGPNLEFAIVSALQEIVERHATMIWWSNAQPLPSIREFPPALAALWDGAPARAGQRAWLIPLPNEFGIPVMAGVVEHPVDRLLTAGFAARSNPQQAAQKAWAEALTLQDGARNLDRPEGGYRQAIKRGDVPGKYIKPWRGDRRYLDDYRPDFRDVVDLTCQLQIFLDPRAAEHVRPWIDTPAGPRISDVPAMADGTLRGYARSLESKGYEVFFADLTTRDVAATGLRVVRVFVPGLIGNFAAAFPYQGKGRLRDAAVELGWRSAPLAEEEINVFPLPHA
jgi:ribosomal protein S12 methylthiotransferase accessory factor